MTLSSGESCQPEVFPRVNDLTAEFTTESCRSRKQFMGELFGAAHHSLKVTV